MNFDRGLLKKLGALLGFDPDTVTREEAQKLVRARMERKVNGIAKRMVKDGHTPDVAGKAIRSALFRLWRDAVLTFNGGGHLADVIRDAQDDAIILELMAQPLPTDQREFVRLVMEATLERTF